MEEALKILDQNEPKSTNRKRKAQGPKAAGKTRSLPSEEKSKSTLTAGTSNLQQKRPRILENGIQNEGEVFPKRLRNAFFLLSDNRLTNATNLITKSTFENFWGGHSEGDLVK